MTIEDVTEIVPEVATITPFQKLVLSIGEIPTNYLDSMSYAEQVTWFCMFLQEKVLPVVNQHSEKILEIINYLNNLDLQDEVNNKLDEMAEDGTLQEIIAAYLNANAVWCFDTVADMKQATNLINGSYAKTLGYHEINDGGAGLYKITDTVSLIDHQEQLDSELYANLILNNKINVKSLGAYGNGINDDTEIIQKALDLTNDQNVTVYFPLGCYMVNDTLSINKSIKIEGEYSTLYNRKDTDVPSAFLCCGDIGTLLQFSNNSFGTEIINLGFDGQNNNVTLLNLTKSKYTRVTNCSFNRCATCIYLSGNSYHNIIEKCYLNNFTDYGINIGFVNNVRTNANIIRDNIINILSNNCYGIYCAAGNSINIINNMIEGNGIPITLYGSGGPQCNIDGNRIETHYNVDNEEIIHHAINLVQLNTRYSPMDTKIKNNQIYSQITNNNEVTTNSYFDLLNEGYGTNYDKIGYSNINIINNGGFIYDETNQEFTGWASSSAHITLTPANDYKCLITVSSENTKYPNIYQFMDIKQYRGKKVVLSAKFKAQNITTNPRVEVYTYKGGNKTLSNRGTLLTNQTDINKINQADEFFIETGQLYIPEDADHLFVNINVNGSGATTPADNEIIVDWINLSDKYITDFIK